MLQMTAVGKVFNPRKTYSETGTFMLAFALSCLVYDPRQKKNVFQKVDVVYFGRHAEIIGDNIQEKMDATVVGEVGPVSLHNEKYINVPLRATNVVLHRSQEGVVANEELQAEETQADEIPF